MVLHGLKLLDGRYVARIYGVEDNPKGILESSGGAHFLGSTLNAFLSENNIGMTELWEEGQEHSLWSARLYPAAADMEEAVRFALLIEKMAHGKATQEEQDTWRQAERLSLQSSFNRADVLAAGVWQRELENRILASRFLWKLEAGVYYKDALKVSEPMALTGKFLLCSWRTRNILTFL